MYSYFARVGMTILPRGSRLAKKSLVSLPTTCSGAAFESNGYCRSTSEVYNYVHRQGKVSDWLGDKVTIVSVSSVRENPSLKQVSVVGSHTGPRLVPGMVRCTLQ
jgi:hypothetical protein